jgi:serine kinase of HPr protein (carbohydrate metabolism regulator)
MIRHAGLLAARVGGHWRGVLVEGASGAGKSDLALRALAAGMMRLVADDRTLVWAVGGRLYGRAPEPLAGLLEVRGLDIVRETALPFCEIVLVARPGAPERLPEPQTETVLGVCVPLIELGFLEASAPAKLGRALANFDAGRNKRM